MVSELKFKKKCPGQVKNSKTSKGVPQIRFKNKERKKKEGQREEEEKEPKVKVVEENRDG